MTFVFLVLIILACALLAAIVLIQNPKGGGLAGTFGGLGNQFMGVKQTNDVLEKGTWFFAGFLGVLCIISSVFFTGSASGSKIIQNINPNANQTAPQTTPQNQNQNSVPFP